MTLSPKQVRQADIEAMLSATAAALGLTIDAAYQPGALLSFERIASQAQILMEFPLEDDVEIAPAFSHDRR